MSQHLKEDPLQISQMLSRGIYVATLNQLACWSFAYRDQPAYLKELKAALKGLSLPDLKAEHRLDLIDALSAIDLCSSEEGQKKLGLRKEDISKGENLIPLLQPQAVGRIKVVQGMREYWAALGGPLTGMDARASKAEFHFYQGLISFPTAANVYETFKDSGRGVTYDLNQVITRKVAYQALLRALSSKKIPKTIKTNDLLGPWDGKPIRYKSDGKKIEITVSADKGNGGSFVLSIPPKKLVP
jgi:hypothetical protein